MYLQDDEQFNNKMPFYIVTRVKKEKEKKKKVGADTEFQQTQPRIHRLKP